MRIAFATDRAHATLVADDRLALPALERLRVRVVPSVWDDERVRWDDFDAVVMRSCWDYHYRPATFVEWVDRLSAFGTALVNPAELLRWNAEKTYLRDLANPQPQPATRNPQPPRALHAGTSLPRARPMTPRLSRTRCAPHRAIGRHRGGQRALRRAGRRTIVVV